MPCIYISPVWTSFLNGEVSLEHSGVLVVSVHCHALMDKSSPLSRLLKRLVSIESLIASSLAAFTHRPCNDASQWLTARGSLNQKGEVLQLRLKSENKDSGVLPPLRDPVKEDGAIALWARDSAAEKSHHQQQSGRVIK